MQGKMNRLSFVFSSVAVVTLAAGPVLAADREDNRLGKRVEEQLVQDEKLRDYVLEAKADGGVVTLTGKVALHAAKEHATEVARVPGVRRVDNQIEVAPLTVEERLAQQQERTQAVAQVSGAGSVAPMQPPTPGEAAPPVAEALPGEQIEPPPAPGLPDEKGFVHVQMPATLPGDPEKMVSGETITRSWVDTRVAAELEGDEALKGSNVDVVTSKDLVVTLKGRVASEAARQRALQIARDTKGVKEVDDQLRVAGRRAGAPAAR